MALSGCPKAFGQRVKRNARSAKVTRAAVISLMINAGENGIKDGFGVPTGLLEPTV